MLASILHDLRFALRTLRRAPGFALSVLLSVAIGLGSAVAILAVLDQALFRPPRGVDDPSRVRRLYSSERRVGATAALRWTFSVPDFRDLSVSLADAAPVAAYTTTTSYVSADSSQLLRVGYVSSEFFSIVGVGAAHGRLFVPDERGMAGFPQAVVLSDALWRRAFGSDPTIVGRTIALRAQKVVVTGITPPGFRGVDLEPIDAWLPLESMPVRVEAGVDPNGLESRRLTLIARLGEGVSEAVIASRMTAQYGRTHSADILAGGPTSVRLASLTEARSSLLRAGDVRNVALLNRLAMVSLAVLVVSLGNVAVLFTLRMLRRRRELAIRMAIGVSTRRLAFQSVGEVMILSVAGGALAIVIGILTSVALSTAFLPQLSFDSTEMAPRALAVTAGVAILASLTAGLLPSMLAILPTGADALRLGSDSASSRATTLRSLLLVAHAATCTALLSTAGAFLASLYQVAATQLGRDQEYLVSIDASGNRMRPGTATQALAAIKSLSNVEAAANVNRIAAALHGSPIRIVGEPRTLDDVSAKYQLVDATYLQVARIPLVRGRTIAASDVASGEAIMVINQSMARTWWPNTEPLGACVFVFGNTTKCRRVVGIVGDTRWEIGGRAGPTFYAPIDQASLPGGHAFLVRTKTKATARDVAEISAAVTPILGTQTLRPQVERVIDRLEPQVAPWRAAALLFCAFGLVALFATIIGVYASISFEAAQRRHELAIRAALGAVPSTLVSVILVPVARLIGLGLVLGALLSLATARVIAAFLFDSATLDSWILVTVCASIAVAAFFAGLLPAARAARTDPSKSCAPHRTAVGTRRIASCARTSTRSIEEIDIDWPSRLIRKRLRTNDDSPARHHENRIRWRRHVGERITAQRDDVGYFSRSDRPHRITQAKGIGRIDRRRANRIERRESGVDQGAKLVGVFSMREHAAVGPEHERNADAMREMHAPHEPA
jgi:predicted permease